MKVVPFFYFSHIHFQIKYPLSVTYFKGVNFNLFLQMTISYQFIFVHNLLVFYLFLQPIYFRHKCFQNQCLVRLDMWPLQLSLSLLDVQLLLHLQLVKHHQISYHKQTSGVFSYNTDSLYYTTFSCSMTKTCAIKTYALLFQKVSPVIKRCCSFAITDLCSSLS